jgi:hypothetical protein
MPRETYCRLILPTTMTVEIVAAVAATTPDTT